MYFKKIFIEADKADYLLGTQTVELCCNDLNWEIKNDYKKVIGIYSIKKGKQFIYFVDKNDKLDVISGDDLDFDAIKLHNVNVIVIHTNQYSLVEVKEYE